MKKLLVILLLIGTCINPTHAKVQARIGIKVGPTFGRWNNDLIKNSKLATAGGTVAYLPGLNAGIQARLWFNKFVGLKLDAEFNMSGSKFVKTTGTTIVTLKHRENQVTIPLTVLIGWGNERLRIYAQGGGYFGYIFNGKDNIEVNNDGSISSTGFEKANYDSTYQNLDAGVRFGGGIQVYVDKKLKHSISMDITYDMGFLKTFRNDEPAYFGDPTKVDISNSKILLSIGYVYNFGKSQAEEAPIRDVNPK